MDNVTFASLFSGIGGADLAATAVGWEHKFWCEIDPFCQTVLKYWFNESKGYGDIKQTDFTPWRGRIDVLHGSSPCQAVSISGKRKGDMDDRWLWKEMLRAIREIRPRWVSFENVANLRAMVSSSPASYVEEGVCYEGKEGLLYGIIHDLETEGYTVETFIIPACATGAPHLRKRIWITGHLADAINSGTEILGRGETEILSGRTSSDTTCEGREPRRTVCNREERQEGFGTEVWGEFGGHGCVGSSSEPGSERCLDGGHHIEGRQIHPEPERDLEENKPERGERVGRFGADGKDGDSSCATCGQDGQYGFWEPEGRFWEGFPTQSPVCRGNDGIPFDVDSLAIPFARWRRESLKAYGNALVPQVLYEIYKCIDEIERHGCNT